jgi:hypothetical protein
MRHLSPATAIIGAGAIIAASIYLGLRERPLIQVASQPAPRPVMADAKQPQVETASYDAQARAGREILSALDARRSELAPCAPAGGVAHDYELRVIVDPAGRMLSFAVNDPADASFLDTARCLRQHRPNITVSPPGRPVTVRFAWAFP